MKESVENALSELRRQFDRHTITVTPDGVGGAYFFIENMDIGPAFTPSTSWLGGHITSAFPFADIYPMYIDGALKRASGQAFAAPVVPINVWQGRSAIQVSRINRNAGNEAQSASFKVARVVDFLRRYA
ncbi:hypothetical protein R69927_05644 [Paraburkholderia domus]|jgi:hypothetical protein|uniref:hypothetical protein n=1 Tax=Paraburkholderia domus TaxID=2793075 RepID=UPI0019135DAB|nr:hypothetical protein [Paraburkholderia domus]MBK5050800.1 hypothetical protein [Burkholderia sp. R-70006]MBK5089879.1 hypothetical protein [Burkholderia sp. R-69927]CAE6765944.1 hypothetical protein R70006_03720 [Paraburkholderia domus]CAE6905427.1 hypothetical protein R69927_05644 [Paraburkholderia domus]